MKIRSYVVARDFGFAPNPFHGACTLATCKSPIRKKASLGEWIIGTGSKEYDRDGYLVYAMLVSEVLTYDQYWADRRWQVKKPSLRGSLIQAYGDNIYHRDPTTNKWVQENSHHSFPDGTPNPGNLRSDTQSDKVLIATDFMYWGGSGPKIPDKFRNFNGNDICGKRFNRCNLPESLTVQFIEWLRSRGEHGIMGDPMLFRATPKRQSVALRRSA